jgi:hypothetical protein
MNRERAGEWVFVIAFGKNLPHFMRTVDRSSLFTVVIYTCNMLHHWAPLLLLLLGPGHGLGRVTVVQWGQAFAAVAY